MGGYTKFIFNLIIGLMFLALLLSLAGCASTGPRAAAPTCRGVAFPINQSSPQTAGVK
jgi:uncharacterized membrane protein YedE/YeeE